MGLELNIVKNVFWADLYRDDRLFQIHHNKTTFLENFMEILRIMPILLSSWNVYTTIVEKLIE